MYCKIVKLVKHILTVTFLKVTNYPNFELTLKLNNIKIIKYL